MKPATTLILVVLGTLVLGGAWWGSRTAAPERAEVIAGSLMFPDLAPALQGAARIEITSKGKTLTIARQGDGWGVVDMGGYRVQPAKLREMLTGLTELRLIEPRTSDPEQFARLGLDDPMKPDSTATRLRVLDASGKTLAELITGHRRMRTQGNVPESIYVRRPGENRTYLAEARLPVDSDGALWLDRDIMNIPGARIAAVTSTNGDAVLELVRADGKLAPRTPPDGGALDDFKLEEVARALETLSFTDVKPVKDTPGAKIGTGRFVTTDGLDVLATVFRDGETIWAQFEATGSETAKAEATRLNERLRGWVFQLGAWKQKALAPSLDDLKPTPPAQPEPGQPPAARPPGAQQ